LVSTQCKADRKDIEKALVGDFRPEYLFERKHSVKSVLFS